MIGFIVILLLLAMVVGGAYYYYTQTLPEPSIGPSTLGPSTSGPSTSSTISNLDTTENQETDELAGQSINDLNRLSDSIVNKMSSI